MCLITTVLDTNRSSVLVRRSWREQPFNRSLMKSCWRGGNSSWQSGKLMCLSVSSTSSYSNSTRTSPMLRNGRASSNAAASSSKMATASAYPQVRAVLVSLLVYLWICSVTWLSNLSKLFIMTVDRFYFSCSIRVVKKVDVKNVTVKCRNVFSKYYL